MRIKVGDKIKGASQAASIPSSLSDAIEQVTQNYSAEYKEMRAIIRRVADEGVSLEEAERLAARFLDTLCELGGMDGHIQRANLDVKMKKNGYKTLKAKVYLDTVQKSEKKPTEAAIEAVLLTDESISRQQDIYERAEENAESLKRVYDVFRDAHIYFRGIAKGAFNGGG